MNKKQILPKMMGTFAGVAALCVASLLSAGAVMAQMEGDITPMKGGVAPMEGGVAPNFTLKTLDDKPVELHKLTGKSRVVLVVLRGWPGYQCPFCDRQVRDLMLHAPQIKERGVQMLFVYPGPSDQLKAHAREFLANKDWPPEFILVTDPDYAFTTAYGLRWDAPNETAYPSTFILDRDAKVLFARVSKEHGGRVNSEELLKHL